MKKLFVLLLCLLTGLFFVSCGGSGNSDSQQCEKNLDCPVGKICSGGMCVSPEESEVHDGESGDGNNGELPDDESGSDGGNSSSRDEESAANDSDSTEIDEPITGNCEPGKTQKCEYQGPEGSENVGPCKAAVRTCREDGTWGKCEGEVLPVYESGEELCTNGIDDDCDGVVDNGTAEGGCAFWQDIDVPDADADADVDPGTIDVGYTGDYSEAYQIPEDVENVCVDSCIPMKAECFPSDINEGEANLCDGLDNDCDGKVDEGCPCSAGQTQPCFAGPPNFRNIGTCHDGVQTCKVSMRGTKSVGVWGDCVGGISPKQDVCDNADNNCNGCEDDKLCCAPPIDCAYNLTADSPFLPFKYKIIDGKQIYDTGHKFNDADTATWEWSLTKGPCDIVLNKVNSFVKGGKTLEEVGDIDTDNGVASTTVAGVGLSQFKVKFRLSGNYVLHLKVTRPNGEVHECEWVIKVASDGLRIELCWDTTGSVDVDLHMGKNGTTSTWASSSGSPCYFGNCKVSSSNRPDWGYANTMNYDKTGNYKSLPNPRLDMDNISTQGEPENINVDNPNNGDTFRVGVKYYSGSKLTHPVINVYCGGSLKATYGVEPQVSGFTSSPYFWKVVEIKWVGDYASDACELTPQWNDSTGYVVNSSVPGYSSW